MKNLVNVGGRGVGPGFCRNENSKKSVAAGDQAVKPRPLVQCFTGKYKVIATDAAVLQSV